MGKNPTNKTAADFLNFFNNKKNKNNCSQIKHALKTNQPHNSYSEKEPKSTVLIMIIRINPFLEIKNIDYQH